MKPPISNPFTIVEANIIIKVFITKVNKPKLNKFIGKVKRTKNGLITIFKKPKTKANIKALHKPET